MYSEFKDLDFLNAYVEDRKKKAQLDLYNFGNKQINLRNATEIWIKSIKCCNNLPLAYCGVAKHRIIHMLFLHLSLYFFPTLLLKK